MTKHENIAKALKARLSELTNRVVEIDSELRKPLSADLEEQATHPNEQIVWMLKGKDGVPPRQRTAGLRPGRRHRHSGRYGARGMVSAKIAR